MVAAKIKMNANGAHTFLEVRILRHDEMQMIEISFSSDSQSTFRNSSTPTIHVLRVLVHIDSMWLPTAYAPLYSFDKYLATFTDNARTVGGAATVNALTGMNIIASCFLLPIGIAVYVVFGGLRATFICDWAHTIILFIVIYIFLGKT